MDDIEYVSFFIPKFLWEGDEALSRDECIVLSAITSLDDNERGCFASNEYLAKLCRCSDRTITNVLTSLKTKGYITVSKGKSAYRTIHSVLSRLSSPQSVRSKSAGDAELNRKVCEVKSANGATRYIRENNKNISSSTPQTPQGAKMQKMESAPKQESVSSNLIPLERLERIRQFYNEHRGDMPPCDRFTNKMVDDLCALEELYDEDIATTLIAIAERNDFLQGKVINFTASLYWLLTPKNADKVIAGNYIKYQRPPKTKEEQDWDALWDEIAGKSKPQGA